MITSVTLELGIWAVVCIIFTLIWILGSGKFTMPIIFGLIVYLIGVLIGMMFKGLWKLFIWPFKSMYAHPIPWIIVLGSVVSFIAVRYVIKRIKSRNKENKKQQSTQTQNMEKPKCAKVIDTNFED